MAILASPTQLVTCAHIKSECEDTLLPSQVNQMALSVSDIRNVDTGFVSVRSKIVLNDEMLVRLKLVHEGADFL